MADEKRTLKDEVAALAEAVQQLKDQLARQGHACCPGHCWHYHYWPVSTISASVPYQVTYSSGGGYSSGGAAINPGKP